ncbi:glycosyltransferase family 2 protein [Vreelandella zhanjiangensis]|uniref:glycosyltransferase family 2 protein n=1 Tax=Vreelandella zhanjiangensis TaxID=1121960 RepID=UPI000369AAFE|nr:glycosyltransferase family 2 protein [Halomonas zhanjiangensis]
MNDIMFNNLENKYIELVKNSELFDSEWYAARYPDVSMSGLEPIYHFLKYGTVLSRDPGPKFSSSFYYDVKGWVRRQGMNPLLHFLTRNKPSLPKPDNVLWSANKVAEKGDHDLAINLAKQNLPDELHYTINLLEANKYLMSNDESKWLKALNTYLSHFNVAPLKLTESSDKGLLARFYCHDFNNTSEGPLITVIMPVWNSEDTILYAAKSILNQSWRNIELIIVDDCSTDKTWKVLKSIKSQDSRVKIFKNKVNVGPYVSKNIGLTHAQGDYITGHDADDWAHPQRLEKHYELIKKHNFPRASLTHMVRVRPDGYFGHIGKITGFSFDGAARKASISCMFERDFVKNTLGFWDSVRFGADSEMIARAERLLGDEFKNFKQIGMICLDLETSLTNDPEHGIRSNNGGLSITRKSYRESWVKWHDEVLNFDNAYLEFPLINHRYFADGSMRVPYNLAKKI